MALTGQQRAEGLAVATTAFPNSSSKTQDYLVYVKKKKKSSRLSHLGSPGICPHQRMGHSDSGLSSEAMLTDLS